MKKIGFIGGYDKADFIMYLAKVLQILNKKVVVVDATIMQKTKYIVPSISPTKSYITDFEGIDFAVGFQKWEDIEKYLGLKYDEYNDEAQNIYKREVNENKITYDYVLVDIDTSQKFEGFEMQKADINYFVTAFDAYSLKKGMEVFENLKFSIDLTKILFSYERTKEEEDYLNNLSLDYKVNWRDYTIYFPIMSEDIKSMHENEIIEKIRFRKLSMDYKESLASVIQDISKENSMGQIRKAMKD